MPQLRKVALTLAMVLLHAVVPSAAAQKPKTLVFVDHTGSDAVGQELAYAVREELRRSAAYDAGSEDKALFMIELVTLDWGERAGNASAVSVTYVMSNLLPLQKGNPQTWLPIFLRSSVLAVGRDRVKDQARAIVANFDAAVEGYWAQSKQ